MAKIIGLKWTNCYKHRPPKGGQFVYIGHIMEKITLSKPITVEIGKETKELRVLQLNFEDLSVADLRQIQKMENMISSQSTSASDMATPKKLSFDFQLASGFLAAVKGTEGLTIDDFTRLSMTDALALAQISSFFWLDVA